ncbi:MAG: hypothetical protein IID08_05585 [Candidatus Hydrogenedentes bacterium]|nr:hypothetical protein [Candidatus Hydrogenedentota bacterium]
MRSLKKARIGTFIMYGGYVLAILLTFLFGPAVPLIGILGLFVALAGYGIAFDGAKCPECACAWLNDAKGLPLLIQLPLGATIHCRECGHTVDLKNAG